MKNKDYLICPICQDKKKNLTKHLEMYHHLTREEIQKKNILIFN